VAAAYRSGEKITNNYDGITHDYTRKGGIAHAEILLPEHAPINKLKKWLNTEIRATENPSNPIPSINLIEALNNILSGRESKSHCKNVDLQQLCLFRRG